MTDFDNAYGQVSRLIAFLMAIITSIVALLGINTDKKTPAEDPLLTFTVISDVHMQDSTYRRAKLSAGLEDMSKNVKADLVIIDGDCTDHCEPEQWKSIETCFINSCTVKDKIIAVGNHDTWNDSLEDVEPNEYKRSIGVFLEYANRIMGTDFDKPYFVREFNGIRFIVLSSDDSHVACDMTDAQIDWADRQLAAAQSECPGTPIFVLLHQPFNYTHAVGANIESNGFNSDAQSEKLKAVLDKYDNVFMFSGHQHYGFNNGTFDYPKGFKTVETVGEDIVSVNLPSYMYTAVALRGGDPGIGTGMVVYVYKDRIEMKARNFIANGWLDNYQYSFVLK